jgi:signal transduction histidine kinase
LGYSSLIEDAATVLRTLIPIEREVGSEDGHGYLMRLRPYRTVDDRISGIVVTFVDITERIQHEQELEQLTQSLDMRVRERTQQVQVLASQLLMAEQHIQERMVQILHDDLQQVLYSAMMHIKMLTDELSKPESLAASELLADLEQIVSQAVVLTRRMIGDLAPPVLDRTDFLEVLRNLAARVKQMHGLTVHLETDDIPPLENENARLVLYQVARELLFNIVKHAGVNEATLIVAITGEELRLEVRDKGGGFAVDSVNLGGGGLNTTFGLTHARQRLSWLGGEIHFESQPGNGTRVTVKVPLAVAQSPLDKQDAET